MGQIFAKIGVIHYTVVPVVGKAREVTSVAPKTLNVRSVANSVVPREESRIANYVNPEKKKLPSELINEVKKVVKPSQPSRRCVCSGYITALFDCTSGTIDKPIRWKESCSKGKLDKKDIGECGNCDLMCAYAVYNTVQPCHPSLLYNCAYSRDSAVIIGKCV